MINIVSIHNPVRTECYENCSYIPIFIYMTLRQWRRFPSTSGVAAINYDSCFYTALYYTWFSDSKSDPIYITLVNCLE